jgi:hypothetical protein
MWRPCPCMTECQRLKCFSGFYEFRYRNSLQNVVIKCNFHENNWSDVHTARKNVSEFIPIVITCIDPIWVEFGVECLYARRLIIMSFLKIGTVQAVLR